MQTSKKNLFLRTAYKEGEEKMAHSLHLRPQLHLMVEYLKDEMKHIGDYIRSKNIDEEIKME